MKGGIYPIVLAGGTGTRLWPLSKKKCPKQFLDLLDSGQTLFQQAVKRAASISNFSPVIVGSSSHRFLLSKQLKEIGLDESSALLEPAGRNTASSVIAAVLQVRKVDPDARVCIIPSDHYVDSDDLFAHVVVNLASELDEGDIGLVGVKPSEPSSQYGYIQLNSSGSLGGSEVFGVSSFVEKPAQEKATAMLKQSDWVWNCGVVIGLASTILEQSKLCTPSLVASVESAVESITDFFGFKLLGQEFLSGQNISFDMAVLEKVTSIKVGVYQSGWDDLGTWYSLVKRRRELGLPLLFSEREIEYPLVSSDLLVVDDADVLLAIEVGSLEQIDQAVNELKARGREDLLGGLQVVRPWGEFKILSQGQGFLVKQLVVMPKSEISLQSHKFRMEHWVIISGEGRAEVNGDIMPLYCGSAISINKEDVHRLSNVGESPLIIIEVQIGNKLSESDIVRYDDKYLRHMD